MRATDHAGGAGRLDGRHSHPAATDSARLVDGPLRIAVFTDTYAPQLNGVARTLARLAGALDARGAECRVVTTSDPEETEDSAGAVVRFPSVPFWAYPQLRLCPILVERAEQLLRAWRPALVHAATPFGAGLAGAAAARRLGIPLVTSYHTHFAAYVRHYRLGALEGITWSFLRWFHNRGRRTYAPTHAVLGALRARAFTNLRLWSRGVDTAQFTPTLRSRALREGLGVNDEMVLVAYVGRLAPEKGIDVAMEAMRRVQAGTGGRVCFALAGDGPLEARCRASAPPGTTFMGRLDGRALGEFFASADVLVFPSETDTFGNVLLEGMASRLAVVGADTPSTRELLGAGRGVLFPAGDAAALAQRILWLAGDAERRRRLSARALEHAQRASWDAVFDELLADYGEVVAASRSELATAHRLPDAQPATELTRYRAFLRRMRQVPRMRRRAVERRE